MNETKLTNAQHRIEELWNETEGHCYVSFSGGKDSTVLLAIIKQCRELGTIGDIPAVFSNTGVELGVTVNFVKLVKANWYPNVVMIRPVKSFDWVMKEKGKPLRSKMKSELLHRWHVGSRTECVKTRLILGIDSKGVSITKTKLADRDAHMLHDNFPLIASNKCCDYLKKQAFERYAKTEKMSGVMLGVRVEEGGARSIAAEKRLKNGGKLCTWTKHGIIQKAPLIDWTDEDIEQFISEYSVPLSDAYTKFGFVRTGCMACPYSTQLSHDLEYLYHNEPNRYMAAMHWLKDVYIAQNVILPFDEAYERERERVA